VIHVRKPWEGNYRATVNEWYKTTKWCCEEFGLPSEIGKWKFKTTVDYMDFYFRDPRDAELFILKWM